MVQACGRGHSVGQVGQAFGMLFLILQGYLAHKKPNLDGVGVRARALSRASGGGVWDAARRWLRGYLHRPHFGQTPFLQLSI